MMHGSCFIEDIPFDSGHFYLFLTILENFFYKNIEYLLFYKFNYISAST